MLLAAKPLRTLPGGLTSRTTGFTESILRKNSIATGFWQEATLIYRIDGASQQIQELPDNINSFVHNIFLRLLHNEEKSSNAYKILNTAAANGRFVIRRLEHLTRLFSGSAGFYKGLPALGQRAAEHAGIPELAGNTLTAADPGGVAGNTSIAAAYSGKIAGNTLIGIVNQGGTVRNTTVELLGKLFSDHRRSDTYSAVPAKASGLPVMAGQAASYRVNRYSYDTSSILKYFFKNYFANNNKQINAKNAGLPLDRFFAAGSSFGHTQIFIPGFYPEVNNYDVYVNNGRPGRLAGAGNSIEGSRADINKHSVFYYRGGRLATPGFISRYAVSRYDLNKEKELQSYLSTIYQDNVNFDREYYISPGNSIHGDFYNIGASLLSDSIFNRSKGYFKLIAGNTTANSYQNLISSNDTALRLISSTMGYAVYKAAPSTSYVFETEDTASFGRISMVYYTWLSNIKKLQEAVAESFYGVLNSDRARSILKVYGKSPYPGGKPEMTEYGSGGEGHSLWLETVNKVRKAIAVLNAGSRFSVTAAGAELNSVFNNTGLVLKHLQTMKTRDIAFLKRTNAAGAADRNIVVADRHTVGVDRHTAGADLHTAGADRYTAGADRTWSAAEGFTTTAYEAAYEAAYISYYTWLTNLKRMRENLLPGRGVGTAAAGGSDRSYPTGNIPVGNVPAVNILVRNNLTGLLRRWTGSNILSKYSLLRSVFEISRAGTESGISVSGGVFSIWGLMMNTAKNEADVSQASSLPGSFFTIIHRQTASGGLLSRTLHAFKARLQERNSGFLREVNKSRRDVYVISRRDIKRLYGYDTIKLWLQQKSPGGDKLRPELLLQGEGAGLQETIKMQYYEVLHKTDSSIYPVTAMNLFRRQKNTYMSSDSGMRSIFKKYMSFINTFVLNNTRQAQKSVIINTIKKALDFVEKSTYIKRSFKAARFNTAYSSGVELQNSFMDGKAAIQSADRHFYGNTIMRFAVNRANRALFSERDNWETIIQKSAKGIFDRREVYSSALSSERNSRLMYMYGKDGYAGLAGFKRSLATGRMVKLAYTKGPEAAGTVRPHDGQAGNMALDKYIRELPSMEHLKKQSAKNVPSPEPHSLNQPAKSQIFNSTGQMSVKQPFDAATIREITDKVYRQLEDRLKYEKMRYR